MRVVRRRSRLDRDDRRLRRLSGFDDAIMTLDAEGGRVKRPTRNARWCPAPRHGDRPSGQRFDDTTRLLGRPLPRRLFARAADALAGVVLALGLQSITVLAGLFLFQHADLQ
jgi:hypothetical protein